MRGQILDFDPTAGSGLISGDDGIRYAFNADQVTPPASITPGLRVDFVPVAGQATSIMLLAAAVPSSGPSATPGVPVDTFDFAKVLFSFEGRIRRQHFWLGWLICLGIGIVLGWIPFIGLLISIALIWPNVAITVKRLHDMGHSGWLAVIPWIGGMVAIGGGIATVGMSAIAHGGNFESNDPAVVWPLVAPALGIFSTASVVQLGFLLWIGLTEGQPGDNRFGPNPKLR